MAQYCSLNGKILPQKEASLGVTDLALLRGYGIFDYFLFRYGRPMLEAQYLERFYNSAEKMGLEPPMRWQELSRHMRELIAANGEGKGAIRLLLTGGYSPDGYSPGTPNLIVLQHPWPSYPETHFTEGVGLITHHFQREWPEVKSINYLTGIKLLPEIRSAGALEVLYHYNGVLRESVRSNVFLINDKEELVTPDRDILFGITRDSVIKAAAGLLPVVTREVRMEEVYNAREVFLTGSNKSAMPVVRIDGRAIGDGKVGYWARTLKAKLEEYREAYYQRAEV
ncbi:MAG: aminotransferase class IV [Phaeodactylibacter sp.]|nr:aminotransferase class IV [Phaeodactylibacter sp.]